MTSEAALQRRRERNRDREAENRRYINAIKRARGCVDCGTRDGRLEFDHRPETDKRFGVGSAGVRSRQTIDAEIAKCDVRCSLCHQRRHIAADPTRNVRAGRLGGLAGRGKTRPWQTPEWYARRRGGLL